MDETSPENEPRRPIKHSDFYLSKSATSQYIKRLLQAQGMHMSGAGVAYIQELTTEFILFITGEAAEKLRAVHQLTLNKQALIDAMDRLGLHRYSDPLQGLPAANLQDFSHFSDHFSDYNGNGDGDGE